MEIHVTYILMVQQLVNFLFVIKNYPRIFCKVQISTNYKKIILTLFVLSVILTRTGTILPVVNEITVIKTCKTDRHDITEILLKVVLNTIPITQPALMSYINQNISRMFPYWYCLLV